MTRFIFIAVLFVVISSCGIPMGNRIDAKNLQVYYLENVPKSKAISFAKFWKENGFVGDNKQVIQLDKNDKAYVIKLIEREEFQEQRLSIDEQSKLQELEYRLEEEVFEENATILITDNTFRPIERK